MDYVIQHISSNIMGGKQCLACQFTAFINNLFPQQ